MPRTSYEDVAKWLGSHLAWGTQADPLSANQRGQVGAMLACFATAMWAEQYGAEQAEEMAGEFVEVFTRELLAESPEPPSR